MRHIRIELKWALIFAGVTLLWMLLERVAGLHDQHIHLHMVITNLFAIPAIVMMTLALREKRRVFFDGSMSYLQGVKAGALVSLFIALLSPGTQWVISKVVTPKYFSNMNAYSVEAGHYETEAAAAAYFNLGTYMVQSAAGALIMGLLTTAVVMIFLRSRS